MDGSCRPCVKRKTTDEDEYDHDHLPLNPEDTIANLRSTIQLQRIEIQRLRRIVAKQRKKIRRTQIVLAKEHENKYRYKIPEPTKQWLAPNSSAAHEETFSRALSQLPPELLIVVLHHLDFVSRQRIRRVCRPWKALLQQPQLAERLYFNTKMLAEDRNLLWELRRNDQFWSLTLPLVRQIVFTGHLNWSKKNCSKVCTLLRDLAARCPKLVTLQLDRTWVRIYGIFSQQLYSLNITNSVVTCSTICLPINKKNSDVDGTELVDWELTGDVAELIVERGEFLCDALFQRFMLPHQSEQMRWIVRCAELLAGDGCWMYWLRKNEGADILLDLNEINYLFRDNGLSRMNDNELRELFQSFCPLADIAAYILTRTDYQLPSPPYPFFFQSKAFIRLINGE